MNQTIYTKARPAIGAEEVRKAAQTLEQYRRGKKQHLTATGLLARCIQHELDHLEGQLFIDVAKSIRRGNQD